MDRVTNISHALSGATRTLSYNYDSVGNRNWVKRDGANGDVYDYDLNDQVTATKLNIANPDTTAPGGPTISYDANGNRASFAAYGPTETYTTNALNQYGSRNSSQAVYDLKGNMTAGLDGSAYTYDAQNRLLSATKSGTTDTFTYDGLNRQIGKKIGTQALFYRVYDGWDLIGEYGSGATSPTAAYLYGASGLIAGLNSFGTFYYYQDASGSTSHLASDTGSLVEWYRYDLRGTPIFYNASNAPTGASAYGVRCLFTGQQWYKEIGLYDLRNRFYSPDIGRFLQADPIGFGGDPTNLYRYCGNNPVNYVDPLGLFNRGQFVRGLGNVTAGGISIVGLAGLTGVTYGVAAPAAVVFGTAAAFGISRGAAQIVASFAGTPAQQQGADQIPSNLSSALALIVPEAVGTALQDLETAYTANTVIQAAMTGDKSLPFFSDAFAVANDLKDRLFPPAPASPPIDDRDPFAHVHVGGEDGGLFGGFHGSAPDGWGMTNIWGGEVWGATVPTGNVDLGWEAYRKAHSG